MSRRELTTLLRECESLDALAYVMSLCEAAHRAQGYPRETELGALFEDLDMGGRIARSLAGELHDAVGYDLDMPLSADSERVLGYRDAELCIVPREHEAEARTAAMGWLPDDALRAVRMPWGPDVEYEAVDVLPPTEGTEVDWTPSGAGALIRLHTCEGVDQVTTVTEGGEAVDELVSRVYRRYTYEVWAHRVRTESGGSRWVCEWPPVADEPYEDPRAEARMMGLTALP